MKELLKNKLNLVNLSKDETKNIKGKTGVPYEPKDKCGDTCYCVFVETAEGNYNSRTAC